MFEVIDINGIGHPKMKILTPMLFQTCMTNFLLQILLQKKVFWRMLVTKLFRLKCKSMGSEKVWLSKLFKIYSFVFSRKKKWNNIRVRWHFWVDYAFNVKKKNHTHWMDTSKEWQDFYFSMYCSFKSDLLWPECPFAYVKYFHWF